MICCCAFMARHVLKLFAFDYSPFPHANPVLIQVVGTLTAVLSSAAFCKGCVMFVQDKDFSKSPLTAILSFLMIDDLLPHAKPDLIHDVGSVAMCVGFSGVACIVAFLPRVEKQKL